MSCKFDNSMYTTIPKEIDEYEQFDIDEQLEEPVDDIDYSYADEEAKEFAHIGYLISKYGGSNE